MSPIFAAPDRDEIVTYTRAGDSAIWTGHHLAAEAFRYNVTSREAFDNVLVDITGTDLLARAAVPG